MPNYTDVIIANVALADIGEAPISALDQNSSTAKKISAMYDIKRDELLRMHPWGFAKKRVLLAKSLEVPSWGYANYCLIPSDNLKILEVDTGEHRFNKEGKYIATDATEVGMLYIHRETDADMFDASFVSLFAKYLSANLAWSVKGSRTLRSDLMNEFLKDLALARGYSATEGTPLNAMEFEGDGIVAGAARAGQISRY